MDNFDRLSGKLFLVTGGTGFIGGHIVEKLLAVGAKVRILDDLSTGRLSNLAAVEGRYELVKGDILDGTTVDQAMEGVSGVFHLAAEVSVPKSIEDPVRVHQINATGTLSVALAAAKVGAKVVFSSSAAVYGETGKDPVVESDAGLPISPYGVQKLNGEQYLRAYHQVSGLKAVCLRYFNVFGPRQDPKSPYSGVITIFTERAKAGMSLRIFGDGNQTRDFVHVSDVARANLLAMQSSVEDGRAINIGTGRSTSLNELAQALLSVLGADSQVEHLDPRNGDILHSLCDPTQARELLGFVSTMGFEDGLRSTLLD